MLINDFTKVAVLSTSLLGGALPSAASTVNHISFDHDTGFSFAASANLAPDESAVTLRAVAEEMEIDGADVTIQYCAMSALKDDVMHAVNGADYRALIADGVSPADAYNQLSIIDRGDYRANAQYIVVADAEGTDNDFIRIQGGAPLVAGETTIYIGDEAVDVNVIEDEDNTYTIRVTDQDVFQRLATVIAEGADSINVYLPTVNSDYVIAVAFGGNMDISDDLTDCLDSIPRDDLVPSSNLSFDLLGHLALDNNAMNRLAGSHCGYDETFDANNYQVREIGALTGFWLPSHMALDDGQNITMSDYFDYNMTSRELNLSKSMLQFSNHDTTSCMGDFSVTASIPQTPIVYENYLTPSLASAPLSSIIRTPIGGGGTFITTGGGGGGNPECDCDGDGGTDIAPVPLPLGGLLLLGGLGCLGALRLRNKQPS